MRGKLVIATALLLLISTTAPATAIVGSSSSTPEGQIYAVDVQTGQDTDRDGYTTITGVQIQADTSLDDSDSLGSNPGEPYFEVEINGEDVVQTDVVTRSEEYTTTLQIPAVKFESLEQGQHSLTVKLGDADDEIDSGDAGNDDRIATWEGTVNYESPTTLDLRVSRSETVVGSPITVGVSGQFSGDISWDVLDAPAESSASIRGAYSTVATLTPDQTGTYEIRASSNGRTDTVTVEVTNERDYQILKRYAPRITQAVGETYYPTRYEAFVQHAELQDLGQTNVENPTMFDIAGRSASWEMDLEGSTSDYASYQNEYPPSVYGSVHRNVEFRGTEYDVAVTYWLFYVYDPKQEGEIESLVAHQSDLETVTVLVDDNEPRWVGASQHYGGELREWPKTSHDGTHLRLYPASGAHSNYLRDTAKFSGSGLLGQSQHIPSGESAEIISDSIYTDQTGGGRTLSPPGSETSYDLITLTGNERWASYEGAFGPNDNHGKIPMQRERWTAVGTWLEQDILSDEAQVEADVTGSISSNAGTVSARADIENVGPKPSQFWGQLQVKPTTAPWQSTSADTVATETVRVGTEQTRRLSLSGSAVTGRSGEWDARLRIFSYRPDVSEQEDIEFAKSEAALYRVTADSTSTTTTVSTTTIVTTTDATSTDSADLVTKTSSHTDLADQNNRNPTTEEPLDETNQRTSNGESAGFTITLALVAISFVGLLFRRKN